MNNATSSKLLVSAALVLLLGSPAAWATAPLFDLVEIDGLSGRLHDRTRGWVDLPESERLHAMARAESCSALGGPRGKYKVANGSLWLHGLYRCGGDVEVASVYPDMSLPVVATWVTGELIAEVGKVVCTSKLGPPIFERMATISVRAGKVTAISRIDPPVEQCRDVP